MNKGTSTDAVLSHSNLATALAAFQREVPHIAKSNTGKIETRSGGGYSYDYADLTDVTRIALPLLGKHGLAFVTTPTLIDSEQGAVFVLKYQLLHESGQSISGEYPLLSPNAPAQQLGSAITYARRYSLCAVTGIAPGGDDDDAKSATEAANQQNSARKPATSRAKTQSKPAQAETPPTVVSPVVQPSISDEDLADISKMVADTQSVDELKNLWDKALEGNFLTAELKQVIISRRGELEAVESEKL